MNKPLGADFAHISRSFPDLRHPRTRVLTAAGRYAGFMQLIALKTRSAAATNSGGLIFFPLLFPTPNFVPRDLLTERWRAPPR